MSYVKNTHHIVFRTKYSQKSINLEYSEGLYRYIWGIIQKKNCYLYRINGMEDHLHILVDIHQSIAIADFVKSIKIASSLYLKESGKHPEFKGWARKYCSICCGDEHKKNTIKYIKNQREHHKTKSFQEEIKDLWKEWDLKEDEKWFWEEN